MVMARNSPDHCKEHEMMSTSANSWSPRRQGWLACLGILALALVLTAAPAPTVSAQEKPPSTPQEKPVVTVLPTAPLPLSPVEVAEKNGTAVRMSLRDVTKLALQNNLDIAIYDTNEELYQNRLLQAYGPYDPAVTAQLNVRRDKRANTRLDTAATGGLGFNQTDNAAWNFAFSQNLPTGGGVAVNFNNSRSDTNQAFALFTPQYSTGLNVQFSQPLWRNRKIDQNRGTIRLANLDLKTNDSQFKQKVTDTISGIQGQYWDLVGTIRDYEIRRESVRLAQITLENNKKKVEIGTLAPIGITEAQADMASREVDLISAEERINNVENALRALISNDRNAEIWRQTIVPTDAPDFKEHKVNLDEAIDTALANRPELEQLAIRIQQNDISYQLSRNMKRYQVDLVAQFGATGTAGPQTIGAGGTPLIRPELVGALGTAYKTLFTEGFTNWVVGFNVQIPLRNRNVEAQLGQLSVQKRQYLMNRKSTEQAIQVDIRNAVQRLETTRKSVETARIARELAKEQLDGEEKRFQAGLSENFRVLDRQRGLSQAQGVELQALINYKKAIITLQKAMYTLLESNDFEVAKSSSERVPILK